MTTESPRTSGDAFPLDKLPLELQKEIIEYAIPQGLKFFFKKYNTWLVGGSKKEKLFQVLHADRSAQDCAETVQELSTFKAMCQVKGLHDEVRALFFSKNEIVLDLSNARLDFSSFTSFGGHYFAPFHHPAFGPVLSDMRNLRLRVDVYDDTTKGINRLREVTNILVVKFLKSADSSAQEFLLKNLTVEFNCSDSPLEPLMFPLEELVGLRKLGCITKASISGVPVWFQKCLEKALCDNQLHIPRSEKSSAKRRVPREKLKSGPRPSGKAKNPLYDWRKFAEQLGIEVPDHVDQYFNVE